MTAKVFSIIPASAKTVIFVTDRTKVVYIPTKHGYLVLLSPRHPEELLNWMEEMCRD